MKIIKTTIRMTIWTMTLMKKSNLKKATIVVITALKKLKELGEMSQIIHESRRIDPQWILEEKKMNLMKKKTHFHQRLTLFLLTSK